MKKHGSDILPLCLELWAGQTHGEDLFGGTPISLGAKA